MSLCLPLVICTIRLAIQHILKTADGCLQCLDLQHFELGVTPHKASLDDYVVSQKNVLSLPVFVRESRRQLPSVWFPVRCPFIAAPWSFIGRQVIIIWWRGGQSIGFVLSNFFASCVTILRVYQETNAIAAASYTIVSATTDKHFNAIATRAIASSGEYWNNRWVT